MKRSLITLALLILPVLNAAAWTSIGKPGELHFSITINQPTCELVDAALEVDLGTMTLHEHRIAGDTLGRKAFSIGLKECGDVARAYVKMDGEPDANDHLLFALSGGAQGVGLKVVNSHGGQQLPVASDTGNGMEWPLVAGQDNQLDYIASYVVTQLPVTAGKAEALVNFTVSYE